MFALIFAISLISHEAAPSRIECIGPLSSLARPSPLEARFVDYYENFKVRGRSLYLLLGRPIDKSHDRDVLAKVTAQLVFEKARARGFTGSHADLLDSTNLKTMYLPAIKDAQDGMLLAAKIVPRLTTLLRRQAAFEAVFQNRFNQLITEGLSLIARMLPEKILRNDLYKFEDEFFNRLRLSFSNIARSENSRLTVAAVRLASRDLEIASDKMDSFFETETLRDFGTPPPLETEIDVFREIARRARIIIKDHLIENGPLIQIDLADREKSSVFRTSLVRLGWVRREDIPKLGGILELTATAMAHLATDSAEEAKAERISYLDRIRNRAYKDTMTGTEYSDPAQSLSAEEVFQRGLEFFSPIQKLQEDYRNSPFWELRSSLSISEITLLDQVIPSLLRRLYGRQKERLKSAGLPNSDSAIINAANEDAKRITGDFVNAVTREWVMNGVQRGENRAAQVDRILDNAVHSIIERVRFDSRLDQKPEDPISELVTPRPLPVVKIIQEPAVAVAMPIPAPAPPKPKAPKLPKEKQKKPVESAEMKLVDSIPESVEPDREYVLDRAKEFLRTLHFSNESYFAKALQSPSTKLDEMTGTLQQIYRRWLAEFGIN